MKFPTYEEMAQNVAEKALDEYEYKGKTLREWIEIISASEHGTNLAEVGTDLISRAAAIDALDKCHCGGKDENGRPWIYKENAVEAIEMVEPSPSAEPKRGKWIEDKGQQTLMQNFIEKGEVWRVCSVCGAGHMIGHKYECDKAYHETHHNFCPNCGAKMEVDHESN